MKPKIVPDVVQVREQIVALKEERDAIAAQKEKLHLDRERFALAALGDGDQEAKAVLDESTAAYAACDAELANITMAIAAAEARLREAEAEVARRREISRATKVKEVLQQRQAIVSDTVTAIEGLARHIEGLIQSGRELRELSGKHVNPAADAFATSEFLKAALLPLSSSGLLRMPPPDPAMRRPLQELITSADAIHEAWASKILAPPKDASEREKKRA